ncbi:hypothetical protein F0562_024845 [Nyssa sinensis]|uniref:Uncharacterized protein n=1 Tax=Nyssa sinensis TaxID=561372 RepID=A0A5J5BH00_9ASTE|nr:hypothetical protein F0562_024845 [Nyssa sinensis]
MQGSQSSELSDNDIDTTLREVCANGLSMKTNEVEARLDEGNIQEAESSLREGLSLNFEEARALLGRLEYQRGNVEGALHVFDGIDLQAAIQRLQPLGEKQLSKKGRSRTESLHTISQHAASLVLEAIYLKAKSLQKLGRLTDAAHECKSVLDAVEKIFYHGIPDVLVDDKLQETVSHAVELLPELWKQAWIQKGFAVFLLYCGVEASPPSLAVQIDGSYVPRNNLEESILLLMILMRKFYLGKTKWDPSVMEHLTLALSLCGQTCVLAKQLQEVMPGVFHRVDRWKALALCYSGAGQNKAALNLLRKSLHKHEKPNDLISLLLAAKICSDDALLAAEGVEYAQRAIMNSLGLNEHLKGVGLRILGLCLGKKAKVSSSDFDRCRLQSESSKLLDEAISLEHGNSDLIFELGASICGASKFKCSFERFSEAEAVIDAALDETAKWEQGPLLRIKAKLKISQSLHMDAIETYRYLLALVQAQRKSFGPLRSPPQVEDDKVNEDMFGENRGLSVEYSAETLHAEGVMCQGRGQIQEALSAYINALLLEPHYVPCKILIGAVLLKMGSKVLPVARSLLSDALRIDPTNRMAWYYLGLVHKDDGRIADATDCFQAASMLEESDPVESFSSIL